MGHVTKRPPLGLRGQQCDERGGGRVRKMLPERAAVTGCRVLWGRCGVVTRGLGNTMLLRVPHQGTGTSGQCRPGLGKPTCELFPWKEKLAPREGRMSNWNLFGTAWRRAQDLVPLGQEWERGRRTRRALGQGTKPKERGWVGRRQDSLSYSGITPPLFKVFL